MKYFYTFRSVGRMAIYAVFALSLLAAFGINAILIKFKDSCYFKFIICMLLLCGFGGVAEGMNTEPSWRKTTNLKIYTEFYENISREIPIQRVMALPHNGFGFYTSNYTRLAQIGHRKPLFGVPDIKSPLNSEAKYLLPNNPEFLSYLVSNKIDTVFLHRYILDNFPYSDRDGIKQALNNENNFEFAGKFGLDKPLVPSILRNSALSVDIYKVKKVVTMCERDKRRKTYSQTHDIYTQRINKDHYRIFIKKPYGSLDVYLDEPFSLYWQMYVTQPAELPNVWGQAFANSYADENLKKIQLHNTTELENTTIASGLNKFMFINAPTFDDSYHKLSKEHWNNYWSIPSDKYSNGQTIQIDLIFTFSFVEQISNYFRILVCLVFLIIFALFLYKKNQYIQIPCDSQGE